jgi:glyoxylate utilization-related uncharacterized protein
VRSAELTKFGPGGGSKPHHHDYNHTFCYLTGTARMQIGAQSWQITPGSLVKVPANEEHSLTNIGDEDLIFLVIYDCCQQVSTSRGRRLTGVAQPNLSISPSPTTECWWPSSPETCSTGYGELGSGFGPSQIITTRRGADCDRHFWSSTLL